MFEIGRRFVGIVLLIIVSVILGFFFDETIALLFLSSILLIIVSYHIISLASLDRWLQRYDPSSQVMASVPNNFGAWGDVFVRLTRYMRRYYRSRQSLSRALERLQRATSAMPDGIVILDKIDRIEWCNPVAEQHLGLDLKMDIGQHITHLVRQMQFVEYLTSGDFSKPVIIKQSRYQEIMLSLQLVPYGDEEKLLISRDITRFEKMEIMRRDFIANVSHELRTPLTVINGFLEMLQDNGMKDSDMEKHALGLMSQQSRRMQRLVEDLLTLSRLENGQNVLREEEVDMKELLQNLLHEAQSLSAARHTITLQLKKDDINVLGSADELRSALGNLVSNAVRYTPEAQSLEQAGELLLVSLRQIGAHRIGILQQGQYGFDLCPVSAANQHIQHAIPDVEQFAEQGGGGFGRQHGCQDVEDVSRGVTLGFTLDFLRERVMLFLRDVIPDDVGLESPIPACAAAAGSPARLIGCSRLSRWLGGRCRALTVE